MNARRFLSVAGLWILSMAVLPGIARGDAAVDLESRNLDSGDVTAYQIAIRSGDVRLSAGEGGDGLFDLTYRPSQSDILIIDHENRRVQRLSEQMLRAMQTMEGGPQGGVGTPGGGQQRMSEALRGLPPEERVQMRKRLQQSENSGDSIGEFAPAPNPTGRMQEIAGISCEVVEMIRQGRKISELCLADPAEIDGGEEIVAAMRDMAAFYKDFSETLPPETPAEMAMRLAPFEGRFPLRIRRFENGQAISETLLKRVSGEAVDAAMFEAPAGYDRGIVH